MCKVLGEMFIIFPNLPLHFHCYKNGYILYKLGVGWIGLKGICCKVRRFEVGLVA